MKIFESKQAQEPLATPKQIERYKNIENWEKDSCPRIWIRIIERCRINEPIVTLDMDIAYGLLRLIVGDECNINKDFVHVGKFIGLSEFYGFDKPTLEKIED